MSAREALIGALAGLKANSAQAAMLVDLALEAHAHELAEKIRNSSKLRDYTDDHMSDCNMAADLIDPEA